MSDTHFMADNSMIPPLPADTMPTHFDGIGQPQSPNPMRQDFGIPKFFMKKVATLDADGNTSVSFREMVNIITPGDNKSTPTQKVTDWHRRMWPREYAAFKQGEEVQRSGWPISAWDEINEELAHHLKGMNVYTVEDIANMSDSNLRNIPMGRTLKNNALAFLRANNKRLSEEAWKKRDAEQRAQMENLETQNLELQKQLADVLSRLEDMGKDDDGEPAKKRGRPPKTTE